MRCTLLGSAYAEPWRAAARDGGPYGEVLMMDSLAFGLRALGHDVVGIGSVRRFALERVLSPRGLGQLFADPWKLLAVRGYRLIGAAAARRAFVLEWFGTPPESAAAFGVDPSRFLTPYPYAYGWNRFLGYVLHHGLAPALDDADALRARVAASLARKKRQGVVWGKEAKYFEGRSELLALLASTCTLHTTLGEGRGYRPGMFPEGVINHGSLSREAWRELLAESSFLIGLGDPVSGPSALEALAEGCVYIDPTYATPRLVNGVPRLEIKSQHPFAAGIGPPFVHAVDLRDAAAVRAAAEASFDQTAVRSELGRLVAALTPFTAQAYAERLRGLVE
jgi:hypothetical protein